LHATELQPDNLDAVIDRCLQKLGRGDDAAREMLLEICDRRLRQLSSRFLGKFATVRRWDNTDDVAQGAAMRLHRALRDTVPDSPGGFMALMATQIQRELIDLARKHAGDMSYAANHGTNIVNGTSGAMQFAVDAVEDENAADDAVPLERWEMFHEAVESLPEEHREVFRMAWYLGADKPSVAKALGMSLRTVERRWQEARGMVSEALNRDESSTC
jgi:RNA polymerase sigma factor (sigma-70 family)